MNVLFIITSSLFLLWVIREIFFWLVFWQQNGYRVDRMVVSLISRKWRFAPVFFHVTKWLIFFLYIAVIFYDQFLPAYQDLIVGLYLFQFFFLGKEVYRNRLKKPDLHIQGFLIFLLTFLTVIVFFSYPLLDSFFWLLFLDILVPFILTFYTMLLLFPFEIYTDWQIERAGRKIRTNPHVFVIAVTGSIGKSATKEYLAAILKKKFTVVKTEGKDNTASGVSKTILQKLDNDTEIFVAEISAYKRGEIRSLCELIRPKIGVLTAINNQYRTLFTSLKNIKEINNELVISLPHNGFCLFTGNNKNTLELYKKSKRKKVLYRFSQEKDVTQQENEIVARKIVRRRKNISFDVLLQEKFVHFVLHHTHHLEQLLPALYIASYLGMSTREIKQAVSELK